MRNQPAAAIDAAAAIPDELAALAGWCADADMPIAGVAATLRHLAGLAQALSACLRTESRIASLSLTPVAVILRDTTLPPDAALVRARLIRASQDVRGTADYLHDAGKVATVIARHDPDGQEGAGKAPRLARSCSRRVADLEDALADAEHSHVADDSAVHVIAGHRQVTEALYSCVIHLEHACNNIRGPAAAASEPYRAARKQQGELTGLLFRGAVNVQHTRRRVLDASDALTEALTARRKLAAS